MAFEFKTFRFYRLVLLIAQLLLSSHEKYYRLIFAIEWLSPVFLSCNLDLNLQGQKFKILISRKW